MIVNLSSFKHELSIQKVDCFSSYPEHIHDFIEMLIITKGSGVQLINGKEIQVKSGEVYVINKGDSHGFRERTKLANYLLRFPAEILLSCGREIKQIPGFQALFIVGPASSKNEEGLYRLVLDAHDLNVVEEMLISMEIEFKKAHAGFESALRASLINLVIFLSRAVKNKSIIDGTPNQIYHLANAVAFFEKNYAAKINIAKLAKDSFLSERQFRRVFRQHYMISPLEYLLRVKIQNSLELLQLSDKSVAEIALTCGFYDGSHFTRQFTSVMGITPLEFRRSTQQHKAINLL
ncbi:MAG TPA: hypothetical protein DCY35_06125 [Prolixibacteraceae bacterium]|nr:hypothetical protein [Prolixibacteraceae bacterium]